MRRSTTAAAVPIALALALVAGGCETTESRSDGSASAAADDATDGTALSGPGLAVGERAPDATVRTRDGQDVSLASLYADGPVVVTFYRGGWCPYCTRQLAEWQGREAELAAAGGRLVAITAESPDNVTKTAGKHDLGFDIYSDTTMAAAKAYRVYFDLDAGTKTRYKGYGIDLGTSNASGTWSLPAPGTFVIDSDGVVRYAWADWDYKQRADADEVIAAVRAAQ
ncbi:MAG: peroxiredoxin-like family protein [Phycisphaerales bacterium JB041]